MLGGCLAIRGAITVGDIQAFIQYVRSFTQPITQLANISNMLQQTAAAAERVFEFLDEEEEVPRRRDPVKLEEVKGQVEFKDVHFGYSPDKIIINDFSAEVEPGQKIAIVGPTGAGKTTMVKLLMRFYDVNSGAILVDGHDIRDFSRHDLRKHVRHGAAGYLALQRHDHGEHPLRPSGRDRRRGDRRGQGRPRGPLRPHPAGRLQHGLE